VFTNILGPQSPLNVRDHFSHPYETGKTIVLHALILMFLIATGRQKKCTNYTVSNGGKHEGRRQLRHFLRYSSHHLPGKNTNKTGNIHTT